MLSYMSETTNLIYIDKTITIKENLFAPLKMGYLKNLTLSGKKWYFCGDCVKKW